ncbi:Ig-like domain-containing protein [Oceanirhabdus sp. W0125-5]|uniref:Ig-like domain-containing protein n=1 Tax=Oceanirhabdus sp. W0125-5 TaxID=2999116 RepID=UPI0022F341B3|nr:Ig-like domain-containing protein [Oceanirhabdus sp. W0125-5]WBW98466.1 Ig-like domain-containing protein [Oceanirhabdus sp. W0125-5]
MKKHIYSFILYILLLTTFGQVTSFADELKTVNYDKVWTITFDDNIDKSSVTNHSIYVYDSAYKKLSTNISFGEKGNTIILSPKNNYLPDSIYSIYISKSIKSLNNNNIKDDYIHKFKTEKLSSSNLSIFNNTLENLSVEIKYISDNQIISRKGLLVYNNKLNKPIVISYYDKNTKADSVEIFYKNNKLSGEIYSFDEVSNLIMFSIDNINITSMINMECSSYEYEYIYNFNTIFNKNDSSYQISLTPNILINSTGDIIGVIYKDSLSNYKKIFFKDMNLDKNLSLSLSNIDSLIMNLQPPIISDIKYNMEKNNITLNLHNSEEYLLYYSLNNKTYKPILNSNGNKQVFNNSSITVNLDEFNIDNSTKLYFKASSYKNYKESFLSEELSVSITKLSEEDIAKNIVMNGTFTQFEEKTIQQAFTDYFSSCSWTYLNNNASPEVIFKGLGIYKDNYHEISFLFSVNIQSDNFRLERVKIDNTPLNFSELPYLLQTIYN